MNKQQAYYAKKYKQFGRDKKRHIYDGLWFDTELNRYIDSGNGYPQIRKSLKKLCNKRIRKTELEDKWSFNSYKKYTDFD